MIYKEWELVKHGRVWSAYAEELTMTAPLEELKGRIDNLGTHKLKVLRGDKLKKYLSSLK